MERAYSRLGRYLDRVYNRQATLTFSQVEAVLGRPLPPTARRQAAWWANATDPRDPSQHAWHGWLSTGWEACPDLARGTVTFSRHQAPKTTAAQVPVAPVPASPASADNAPDDPAGDGLWSAARRLAQLAAVGADRRAAPR